MQHRQLLAKSTFSHSAMNSITSEGMNVSDRDYLQALRVRCCDHHDDSDRPNATYVIQKLAISAFSKRGILILECLSSPMTIRGNPDTDIPRKAIRILSHTSVRNCSLKDACFGKRYLLSQQQLLKTGDRLAQGFSHLTNPRSHTLMERTSRS